MIQHARSSEYSLRDLDCLTFFCGKHSVAHMGSMQSQTTIHLAVAAYVNDIQMVNIVFVLKSACVFMPIWTCLEFSLRLTIS